MLKTAFGLPRARLARNPPVFRQRFSSTQAGPRGHWKPATVFSTVVAASMVAGTLGAIYPPPPLSILFPRAAPGPPADPDSPASRAASSELEEKLQSLPALKALRDMEDAQEWYETRPYQHYPEERRVNNLTAGALRGPGKLAVYPLIRAKRDESESAVFLHLGRGLCGHDGIVHGGLLATLLDESLARTVRSTNVTSTLSHITICLGYQQPSRESRRNCEPEH